MSRTRAHEVKRIEFRLKGSAVDRAERAAAALGVPLAEFVREAVTEKLDRQTVVQEVAEIRAEFAALVEQFQDETNRMRRSVIEDSQRQAELIREELRKGIKRHDEITKLFLQSMVVSIQDALVGSGAPPKPLPRARPQASAYEELPSAPRG